MEKDRTNVHDLGILILRSFQCKESIPWIFFWMTFLKWETVHWLADGRNIAVGFGIWVWKSRSIVSKIVNFRHFALQVSVTWIETEQVLLHKLFTITKSQFVFWCEKNAVRYEAKLNLGSFWTVNSASISWHFEWIGITIRGSQLENFDSTLLSVGNIHFGDWMKQPGPQFWGRKSSIPKAIQIYAQLLVEFQDNTIPSFWQKWSLSFLMH